MIRIGLKQYQNPMVLTLYQNPIVLNTSILFVLEYLILVS